MWAEFFQSVMSTVHFFYSKTDIKRVLNKLNLKNASVNIEVLQFFGYGIQKNTS